ncbi:secretion protein [Mycobacterium sp. 1100029.7]|nr:secretion protein [Mycobacterium sp. 1100029.7]
MAAENALRVDPMMMQGFAQALRGGAENLRNQLAALDGQVGEMLGGWQGGSGNAYASAWQQWHRGAAEVEAGLSILASAVAQAGMGFQHSETVSAQAIRQVHGG